MYRPFVCSKIFIENMKKLLITLSVAAVVFLSSCGKDDGANPDTDLTLNLTGLEDLGSSYTYEGWIVVDGSPISTGTFNVDANGNLSQTVFTVDPSDLADATTFVLSIEPVPDPDPAPSAVKILGGDFAGSSATASISHAAALGTSFTGVTGGYIIATPTTSAMDDDEAGVWFLDNTGPEMAAGLTNLPDLSGLAGWTYEGWAVINGTPVSTGTFDTASGADSNASTSTFKGADSDGPPFPGEDFIQNAPAGLTFPADLTAAGTMIVVSIEPVPDNSANPFTLKPLAGSSEGVSLGTFTTMNNIAASTYPGGTVSR